MVRKNHFRSGLYVMSILLVSSLFLCACGKSQGNDLLQNATPNISALTLYVYDGEIVTRQHIFDLTTEREILARLSEVNVAEIVDWSPEDIAFPIYGLEIGGENTTIEVAWSDGYWITHEGTVYSFDYNFEELLEDYEWEGADKFNSTAVLPCARELCLIEDGWYKEMLTKAGELKAPEGVSMELVELTDTALTVKLKSDRQWTYGRVFSVQVYLDGAWYIISTTSENWAFTMEALILAAGSTREESFYIGMYGQLPEGQYRLVFEGMSVEFVVEVK